MKSKILLIALVFSTLCIMLNASPVEARRAFRMAVEKDPGSVKKYLSDKDPEIRRYALYLLVKKDGIKALEVLKKALNDQDVQVEYTAVEALAGLAKNSPEVQKLLEKAAADGSTPAIRQVAVKASWPFHREIKLLRNDPSWDHEVMVVKKISLPTENWSFITDPKQNGHKKGFFNVKFDERKWRKINMGYWEFQGVEDYDGIAWYRIKFRMPDKIDSNAVEVNFSGVDESAWVWLNGQYLGCHDLGQAGVGKPFAMDCTKEIRWGQENVLAVRISDVANAGGITNPVSIEVLK